jgi:hypothetical protein
MDYAVVVRNATFLLLESPTALATGEALPNPSVEDDLLAQEPFDSSSIQTLFDLMTDSGWDWGGGLVVGDDSAGAPWNF